MIVTALAIPEVLLITPARHGDSRGSMAETYNKRLLAQEAGIAAEFVQDNEFRSALAGTVRGLHFQIPPFAQGKLVRAPAGAILDVAVDIRAGSPHFGRQVSALLSAENGAQLWVPPGFAHGICTLEPDTVVTYKVTQYYSREHDRGIAWDDPALGVEWPVPIGDAILSDKDRQHPRLAALPPLFRYEA